MAAYMLKNAAASLGRNTWKSSLIGVPGRESLDMYLDKDQAIPAYMPPQQALAPPSYAPFRFEARRTRIDWRVLHGVDVDSIIRNVDLDLLERIVSTVAHGDIEAEDTRHLTELNFLKIFRLSQLVIEYLLYVQDQLQATNTWLQTDRVQLERYIGSLRSRLREVDIHYKSSKRELRRARRTAKTYETMVAIGKLPGDDKADAKAEAKSVSGPSPEALAAEMALRQQLLVLGERLFRTQEEASQLRTEREDMMGVLREVDTALKTKGSAAKVAADSTELRSAKEQLSKAHADFKMLKAEKDEMGVQLQVVQSQVKVLQGEKEALLVEMASSRGVSAVKSEGAEQEGGGSQLSSMLLEAESRNKVLNQQVQELQATVTTLQKQLMKAAKDAANAAKELPGSSGMAVGTDDLQRALSASESSKADLLGRVHELEQDLSDKRKAHAQDVKALQDELDLYHTQLAEARQQLASAQSKSGGSPGQAGELSRQLDLALKECDDLHGQVSELRSINARQAVSLTGKEDALATAWKLVKDLQAQLSVPAANRDDEAVGRVKAQVVEFERIAERTGVLEASSPAGSLSPAGLPLAVVEAVAALKTVASLSPSDSNMSAANSSFKFSRPAAGKQRSMQESGDGGAASAAYSHNPGTDTPNAKRALAQKSASIHKPNSAVRAELMRRLSGRTAEDVAQYVDKELRVLTEHPFEYQEDDEQQFRELLPYELVGGSAQGGVLSKRPHGTTDHAFAARKFGPAVLNLIDEEIASYGVDPVVGLLSDREYGAVMMELAQRRAVAWSKLDEEGQKQADFLREALLTHLELSRRKVEAASTQSGAGIPDFPDPADYVAGFPAVQGPGPVQSSRSTAPVVRPDGAPEAVVASPTKAEAAVAAESLKQSIEKPPATSAVLAVQPTVMQLPRTDSMGSNRAQPVSRSDQTRDSSPAVVQGVRDSNSSPDLPASRLLPASNLAAADSPTQAASPMNQSLRSAAASQSPNQSYNRSVSPFSAFPGGSLNQSLSKTAGSLNQSAKAPPTASTAVQALNQSLTSGVQSPLARSTGAASPAAGQQLNQSLRQGGNGPGVSATSATGSLGRTLSKQLAAVAGMGTLNMSIRSSGTAKASLRDYSTNDFDDDDDDDDNDGEEHAPANNRAAAASKAGGGDEDDDEYAMDADEGEEVDEGLPGDNPPLLPAAGSGWAPNTTSGRNADHNVSLPSRLARVTGAGEESPPLQANAGNGDEEDWDVSEDGYTKLPVAGSNQAPAAGGTRVGILKQSLPPAAPAWLSDAASTQDGNSQALPKHRPSSEGSDMYELGSIHSFHPNDTAASGRRAASAVPSGLMKPGAWGSPDTTIKSRRAEVLAAGGPTAQGSEASLPSNSLWNETIQTIGSIAGDEAQGFKEQAKQSLGRGGAQWVMGGKPGVQAPGGGAALGGVGSRSMIRRDSFDTVSEMDLM